MKHTPVIAIHGGALFDIAEHDVSHEKEIIETLQNSLKKGYEVLSKKGSSIDAIEQAIIILEDSGYFDAGRGSVFAHNGTQEMDAAIMDGKTKRAGAIGAVRRVKNPVSGARIIMDKSKHVFMVGTGAEEAIKKLGGEMVDPSYFYSQREWDYYQGLLKEGKDYWHHGTVGAVALDMHGNLAAATSTGGLELKHPGRLGDSPVIGAGTYAEDGVIALSCTGSGEYFIRAVGAFKVAAQIKYGSIKPADAMQSVLNEIKEFGGGGGIIGVDATGNVCMPFNTPGMYRGTFTEGMKSPEIGIF